MENPNEKDLLEAIKTQIAEAVEAKAGKEEIAKLEEKLEMVEGFNTQIEALKEEVKEFETLKAEVSDLGVTIKGLKEGAQGEAKDGTIVAFIKSEAVAQRLKQKSGGFETIKISPEELIGATKAAGVMSVNGTAIPTTANILTPDGFSSLVGNYVDNRIGTTPKQENFILPLVNVVTQAGTESIWYTCRINEEGDCQFIGEGDLKPLADAEWETRKSDIKEKAVRWKMSNRLMLHAPSVINDFRTHADELMSVGIDTAVLNGDGVGDNLEGITTAASAFVVPPQLATSYRDANIFDAICAVATQIMLLDFMPTTIVLNVVWKAQMKALKDTDGNYIVPPFVTPDGNTIAGLNVVFTNKIADTHILLGDLSKFNVVISEDVMFAEGFENDDFSKNLMSFKLEAYLGTYLKGTDAGAIVYDEIATILTAIDDPAL